jgi:hypothetical protein
MKRFKAFLLLVVAALALAGGCNGANELAGIDRGGEDVNPTPVRHPRPTPDPCRQFPSECE